MQAKNTKELGAILRQARTARGQTQKELADLINVTQSAISKVEQGGSNVSIGLIFQMLRALDLPLSIGVERAIANNQRLNDEDDDFIDLDAIANTGLKRK